MIFSRRYLFFQFFLLLMCSRSIAQSLLPESPLSSSLANSSVTVAGSFAVNPSMVFADSVHPLHASLSYTPFVGGLKDANQGAIEGIYYSSLIESSFALGLTSLSYGDLYSDLLVYTSIGRSFTLANNRSASAGIRLRYESLSTTANYPKLNFFLFDIGLTLDLTSEFTLGSAALNLLGAKYEVVSGEAEKLQRSFLFGIGYHPAALPLKLLTAIEEDPAESLKISFGAEYDPVAFLALRIGTSTDTGNITTGIGLRYANLSFDAASRFDKALGALFSFGASGAW